MESSSSEQGQNQIILNFSVEEIVEALRRYEGEIIIKCGLEEMVKAFFKDYEIIWHDPNVSSQENQQYLVQLKKLCKVKAFAVWKEAEDYIKTAKTVCHVITSGTNGELLVKEIFSSANVPRIFTFCRAKDYHSTWTKNYEKVLCTETKIEDVILKIQENLLGWQKQTSSFKFDLPAFAPIFDDWDKSQMNNLHFYLRVIPNFYNLTQAKKDFVNLSKKLYLGRSRYEKSIADFEDNYNEYNMEKILNWYTKPTFLHKVINNGLRIATSDSIQYCRLIIKDIETAIKDQYQKKSKNFSGLLYRAAYLSQEEWSSLKANINKEIEMHGFLSVSKERSVALNFMGLDPTQMVFITIIVLKSPIEEEQGFAEVEEFSEIPKEQEILFNIRSRFTVLETEDEYSKDSPYRHLVLLYGAQSLRRFMAKENQVLQVMIEEVGSIVCFHCQALIAEVTEKMFFISLADFKGEIYCKTCLGNGPTTPFLCVPVTEKELIVKINGCMLTNSSQTQIPFYGYKCSKCRDGRKKRYFVCTTCGERTKRWCESCFGNTLSCVNALHAIILESYPFSFWCEKMSENEVHHLEFQNDLVKNDDHPFHQGRMFYETHEYEKVLEYFHLILQQNEIKGNDDTWITGENNSNQSRCDKELTSSLKSVDMGKIVYGKNHLDVANAYNNIGMVYSKQGEYKKALEYHLKSLDIGKIVHGENHPSIATFYDNIGSVYDNLGEYNKALEYHLKSLNIGKMIYGENHAKIAISYNNIGMVYNIQGEYKKALEYYFKSLSILKSVHGENHPDIATAYDNIGSVYDKQGEYKKAFEYHLKSLDIGKIVYGENHPDIATAYNNVGMVYNKQGEYEDALECYLKSLGIGKIVYGENHPDIAASYNNIGMVYGKQGEYKKALEYHLKSLDIKKIVYDENHAKIAISYNNIGMVYNIQGEYKKALEYYIKSLSIFKSVHGEFHPNIATSYNNIGMVYNKQREYNKALDYYFKALGILKSVHGENHESVAGCYGNIAEVYMNQGEETRACEYTLKSLDIMGISVSFDEENDLETKTFLIELLKNDRIQNDAQS